LELAERDAGLIDRNEVPGFIKMGVENWIETEAQAIVRKETRINEPEARDDLDEGGG